MTGRVVAESYRGGVAVVKSDTTLIAPTRGLYVGTSGNIVVDFADGTTNVQLTAPVEGTILPISVIRVKAATTVTDLVALY